QTKEHGSEKRCTAHVSSRIPPHVKTGLLELAEANGWSESKVVAEACTAYLEQDLGEKFGRRLAQQVTEAVRGELKKDSNRQAYLSVHGYYAAEESRIMNAKVLRYLFGEETEMYTQTLKQARHEAYINLKHKVE